MKALIIYVYLWARAEIALNTHNKANAITKFSTTASVVCGITLRAQELW